MKDLKDLEGSEIIDWFLALQAVQAPAVRRSSCVIVVMEKIIIVFSVRDYLRSV